MVAMLIGCFFALVAGLALATMAVTHRSHVGAWSALAAERRALIERDRLRQVEDEVAGGEFPRTVGVRRVAQPGPVVYARRFMARAAWTPLRPGQRAAA
jgi:hypothetical protein